MVFRLDRKRIVYGDAKSTIRLWDVASGKQISQLDGHSGSVQSVAFSPDGERIVSGGDDSTIRLWSLNERLLEVACRVAGRNLSHEEWQQYFADQPYRVSCPQWPEGQ